MKTSTYKRAHIKIGCEKEENLSYDVTPTKCDLSAGAPTASLLHAKKSIKFSSTENISRENSSDSFICREVKKRDLFFSVGKVAFHDLYDWSTLDTKREVSPPMLLQTRSGTKVTCNNKKLALFRYADKVFAIDEKCPHLGGPLHMGDIESLGEAKILCVVCPWHKWRLDLTTGKVKVPHRDGIVRNTVYPTKVTSDGTILIGFSEIDTSYFNGDVDF